MDVENLRHFKRVQIDLGAELIINSKAFQVDVKDISLGGAFIESKLPLSSGDPVELRIFLNNPEHTVEVSGKIAWARPEAGGFGIEFGQLKPIDVWALMRLTESDPIEAFSLKKDKDKG
jgi:hypothetical protein